MKELKKSVFLFVSILILVSSAFSLTRVPDGSAEYYPEITYRADGNGNLAHFYKGGTEKEGTKIYSTTFGDPDNDNKMELVVRDTGNPYERAYNRRNGSYTGLLGTYDKSKSSSPSSLIELNNDGNAKSDFIFRDQNSQLGVLDGDGSTEFSPTGFKNPVDNGDLDQDGYEEILYVDGKGHLHQLNYMQNDPDGYLSDSEISTTSITKDLYGTFVRDADGDDLPEIVFPNDGVGIQAIDHTGDVSTIDSQITSFAAGNGHVIATTDWDKDWKPEYVVSRTPSHDLYVVDPEDDTMQDLGVSSYTDVDLYSYIPAKVSDLSRNQSRYNRLDTVKLQFSASDPEGYQDIMDDRAKGIFVSPSGKKYERDAFRTDSGVPSDNKKDFTAEFSIPDDASVGTWEYRGKVRDEKGAGTYQKSKFNVTRVKLKKTEALINGSTWTDVKNAEYFDEITKMRSITCIPKDRYAVYNNFSLGIEYDSEFRFSNSNMTSRTDTGTRCSDEPYENNKMRYILDHPDQEMDDSGILNASVDVKLNSKISDRQENNWRIPFGNLTVDMEYPIPNETTTVKRYNTFKMNGTVTCKNGECASKGEKVEFWADPLRTDDKVNVDVSTGMKPGEKSFSTNLKYKDGEYKKVDQETNNFFHQIIQVFSSWI